MQAQPLQLGAYPQPSDPISNNGGPEQENNASDTQNFTVCIRVRPLNNKELNKANPKKHASVIKIQDNMVIVVDPDVAADAGYRRDKMYLFDDVFDDSHNTESVFMNSMLPLLDNALTGYNATLFAYGMTGAGKSHTLFGELDPQTLLIQQPGLIFLTLEELFKKIHSPAYSEYEFTVKISYLEIYNEQVKDLIKGDDQNLMILEDPEKGVCVADLTETPVATRNEIMQLIFSGNAKRTMASTAANTFSSRSHAIVQVLIERREKTAGIKGTVLQSKLSLIDLAGSERAAVTENRGIRMLEGANINRSLLALGNCINILSDTNKKGAFVPYRDSKLTRLLKDSLGGNTKTIMIACISPSYLCYEETVNTLKYASRAKNIKRKLHQNVKEVELHVSQYKEIIENLKAEIDTLKGQLKTKGHEDNGLVSQKNKLTRTALSPVHIQQNLEEEEKKIEEASHRIFENLEQNWEINQTLRELNDLELQNRDTLKNLYQHLENTSEEDKVYREQILRQIETLKATMDSNEKIKREIANTLQGNLLENRNLKDQLVEFASSVDTLEDIELARKLLDMDRLDIITQNTEIKKEALNLAKTRVQQNRQISQMEEEMRMMRLMLEEKERLLANNHQLIQNLRSKITEQKAPASSDMEELATRNEAMPILQAADISNTSIKEEKGEQKTSVLKDLLINLEKKITKSLHELDTKILPSHEHDLEDAEVLETIRTLEQQTDRQQARGSVKVKTFEEYHQERKERPLSQNTGQNSMIVHDIDDDNDEEEQKGSETERTMPQPLSSRRSLHRENPLIEDSARYERRGLEAVMTPESALGYAQTNTARTNSEVFHQINLYDKANNTARSRGSDAPGSANPLVASRLRLPIKGLSTGVLETSNRHDNTQNNTMTTINYGDFEDVSSAKHQAKFDGALNLDTVDHSNNVLRPYQSHELKHIHSGDPNMWSNSSIPTIDDGNKTPAYMLQDGYSSKQSVQVPSVGDSSEWNLRRQSFQQLFKGKMREQSVGSIRNTVAVNQFPRAEHSRQSNSILGVLKDRCFESVIGPEGGFQNDSLNLDKRGLEIRSLGQERENLKLFRSRLNNLASISSKKLSKEIVQQIKELVEEYRVKKYILSVKDQDQLRSLGESIMNHEVKTAELARQKRSGSVKEEKKARSSSVRQSHIFKENKGRSYGQSKERKPSTQIETETQPPKRNSVKVLAQGVLSNLHTNYAQTVNKLAPGYGGRPESAKSRNPSNPQTPLQKKGLKERESNMEGKKVGVNLLNMFENQPKGYSKSNKARDSARDQSRLTNDEKVN